MFKKFFGKKNDGFYAQIEDDNVVSTPTAKAPAEAAAATAPTPAVTSSPDAPATKTEDQVDKKAAKAGKKSAKKAETPKVVAPAPAAPAPAAPAITNFATDYLIKPSSISSRRLPGANMSGFLSMAREAKKPINIK